MPRIARSKNNSRFYHVMVQGINKEYIYQKNKYKDIYKQYLFQFTNEFKIRICSYCLMDNHAHILINTDDTQNLSLFMKKVNENFARFYNKENDRVGYVFRNRYNTQEILDRRQLLTCMVYIHKNPIKAGITKNLEEYEFSSFKDFIDESQNIFNTDIKELLFGNVENFKKIFLNIHNKYDYYDIIDKVEQEEKDKKILNCLKYYNEKEKVIKLIFHYKISQRKVSELLNLDRNLVRKIIKTYNGGHSIGSLPKNKTVPKVGKGE